jgi:hypothetical protein
MSHVNNVTYVRWAESARVNWANNYAVHFDSGHRREWAEWCTPRGTGMILRSIRTDYKFVCLPFSDEIGICSDVYVAYDFPGPYLRLP